MLRKPNVLVLDEPTNHLDLESINALNFALRKYDGTVLLVTHDHDLVDEVATRIWHFENGAGLPGSLRGLPHRKRRRSRLAITAHRLVPIGPTRRGLSVGQTDGSVGPNKVLPYAVFVVNGLVFRQHALMQDATDQDTAGFFSVKHHMLAMFHAAQSWPDVVTRSPRRRILAQEPATIFESVEVVVGLGFAPGAKSNSVRRPPSEA